MTFAGRIDSGTIRPGEEVIALPSEKSSRVKDIHLYDHTLSEAFAGQSICMTLEDEIDISRGDMIVRKNNLPKMSNEIDVTLCWMNEKVLDVSSPKRLIVKHTSREINAFVEKIEYTVDVNTLHRTYTNKLQLNDIARVKITTAQKLYFDNYKTNRNTGSIILIDPVTNETVAAGMIKSESRETHSDEIKSTNINFEDFKLTRDDYEKRNGHKGTVIWLTGLSGSGKSTIAKAILARLHAEGKHVNCLDGDNVRHGLCSDLGFTADDRSENIRRIGELAKLFMESGNITICSFISPYQKDRDFVRSILAENRFYETYIDCDIETCKQRDPKGLYKKALAGQINGFTGIDSPYEAPQSPDMRLKSDTFSVEDLVETVIEQLKEDGII